MAFVVICEKCNSSINKITCETRGEGLGYRMVECEHCHTQYRHYKYLLEFVFIAISFATSITLIYYDINSLWVNIFLFYIIFRITAIYCIPLNGQRI